MAPDADDHAVVEDDDPRRLADGAHALGDDPAAVAPADSGIDYVEMLFSANPGEESRPLRKIAYEIEGAAARYDMALISDCLPRFEIESRRVAEFIPAALRQISQGNILNKGAHDDIDPRR